jgi:hypothetical protein
MVSTILVVIRISVEGGATSKIGEARFGKCRLTITPPEFIKGVHEKRIFRKKNWWEKTHWTPYQKGNYELLTKPRMRAI